ncbi:MAG: HEAT repeat domain-containing protein [Planctomycetota bacterium]|nr:HEAT repeat domain-containing protein [Planctomycetota bacterium]
MDKLRSELEALILKYPTEFSFVQELHQLNEQDAWTYEGKTASEHVQAAVNSSGSQKNEYKVSLAQFSAFPHIGVSAIPPLIESFQSDDLATMWKAAFALGQMGSAAVTAIPTLMLGLFNDHPITRAQARWALTQLSEFSLPFLISRWKQKRRGEVKPLLRTIISMGSRALPICDSLTKSIRKADKNAAFTVHSAVKEIIGESKSKRAKKIEGPFYWPLETKIDNLTQEAFDHAVWVLQISSLFDEFDCGDFRDPESWSKEGSQPFRKALESWTPYRIALRSGTLRLTHRPSDSQELEVVDAKSPKGKYFTVSDLCFLATQNMKNPGSNSRGLYFQYQDDELGYPSYLASYHKR